MERKYSIFFKVETLNSNDTHDLKSFAHDSITKINSKANIEEKQHDNGCAAYTVSFTSKDDAERLIHEYNYTHFDNKYKTIAMWNGKMPKYEIFVSGAPQGTTRRDFFLAFERFGEIGRVTTSNSKAGCSWISFINIYSMKLALASRVKIQGKSLTIKLTETKNIKNTNAINMKKKISFKTMLDNTKIDNINA